MPSTSRASDGVVNTYLLLANKLIQIAICAFACKLL